VGLGGVPRRVEEGAQAGTVAAVDGGQIDVDDGDCLMQAPLQNGAHLSRHFTDNRWRARVRRRYRFPQKTDTR
jgi:hypothetical protein